MENLWAPWRMEYIKGRREEGCIFCRKPAEGDRLAENLILHKGRKAFVILNRFPYNSGHLMVIPKRHTSDFSSLTPEENSEMSVLLQECVRVLQDVYGAEGLNIGMNLGHGAGAGIHDHLHYHVVPRWIGDTNFFPVISDTRSIPESLQDTYARLRPHFRGREEEGVLARGGHQDTEART
jgi:ATP adenylyltransferase